MQKEICGGEKQMLVRTVYKCDACSKEIYMISKIVIIPESCFDKEVEYELCKECLHKIEKLIINIKNNGKE